MADPNQAALEDLIRQKRVDEIYSLKRSVQKLEEDIARGIAQNRIRGDPNKAYQLMVQNYVRSLETVLEDSQHWSNTQLGSYQLPDGGTRYVYGLEGFLELDLNERVTWEETEPAHRNAVPEPQTKSSVVHPPRRITESAFRAANVALRDAGVEIETEDTTVDAEYAADARGIGG